MGIIKAKRLSMMLATNELLSAEVEQVSAQQVRLKMHCLQVSLRKTDGMNHKPAQQNGKGVLAVTTEGHQSSKQTFSEFGQTPNQFADESP
eukprot:4501603-Amphidinium_carterae.1